MPFKPGQSGNPSGRKKDQSTVRVLARKYTREAIGTLASIMKSPKASESARVAASEAILSRGWGKPTQMLGNDPDNPLQAPQFIVNPIKPNT